MLQNLFKPQVFYVTIKQTWKRHFSEYPFFVYQRPFFTLGIKPISEMETEKEQKRKKETKEKEKTEKKERNKDTGNEGK